MTKKKTAESATGALEGNTKSSKAKTKEVKNYCFTLHNWTEDELKKLIQTAESASFKYVYGKEICPETGRPHLQCFISLPRKKSWSAVLKLLDIPRIHLEICNGSFKQNVDYCTEDGDFVSNIVNDEPLNLISELSDWMKDIITIVKEPAHPRKVHWFWESKGGVGKSSFCKYLCSKYNAIYIDEGKKSDLINIVYNMPIINSRTIICIDIPRDNHNNVSYKAIEQFKNGMICNTKYETGMKVFNAPHVIIFSNYPPERSKLSLDRWDIHEIPTV